MPGVVAAVRIDFLRGAGFAATLKPGTAAAFAVPFSLTTPRSASLICCAVCGEMTWRKTFGVNSLTVSPSAVVIDFTMRGVTSLPPFAIAAIATVICSGVTPTSWPIGMRVMEILLHDCGARTMPGISPGNSMPVRSPKPKRRMYS